MERFQAAASAFTERKASSGPPGGTSLGTSWFGGPYTTDSWGAHRAPSPIELVEHFKSLAYCCAVRNADAVSAVPLRLYADATTGGDLNDFNDPRGISKRQFRAMKEDGRIPEGSSTVNNIRELRQHRFLNTLNNPEPNGDFDLASLLKLMCLYGDIIGPAYFYPEYDEAGVIQWLWPLFSQYVLPVRNAGSPVVSTYQYFGSILDRRDLIKFGQGTSIKDPYGTFFPPLYAAIEYCRLEDRFVSVQEQLLSMGPRPNLLATPKDPNMPPGADEKDRFERDLNRKHARGSQGGVLVTTGAWDIRPLTYSPTDLSGLTITHFNWQAACGAFGVPYEFFTTDTNLANQQAAKEKHADHGIRPRCKSIAGRLTKIVQKWDYRLFFAFDDPVRPDEETQARIIDMAVKNGVMTINQANEESGRPPVPWGEQPWLSKQLGQPDMLEKLNDAQIAASNAAAVGSKEGGGSPEVGYADVKKKKKPAKAGDGGKKKPDASGDRETRSADDDDDVRSGGGVLNQGDAAVHGVEGLNQEGEDGDPFGWLSWSVDRPWAESD